MSPPVSLLDLFAAPSWAVRIELQLNQLQQQLGRMMATVSEALQGWRDYADALKAQVADLASQLEAAQDTVQQLVDTDAAEDAAQADALTEQIAQQISDALTAAQAPTEPPAVVTEPVEPETEPPAE